MRFQTNAIDHSLFSLLYINHKFIPALKMFLLCLGVLMIFQSYHCCFYMEILHFLHYISNTASR